MALNFLPSLFSYSALHLFSHLALYTLSQLNFFSTLLFFQTSLMPPPTSAGCCQTHAKFRVEKGEDRDLNNTRTAYSLQFEEHPDKAIQIGIVYTLVSPTFADLALMSLLLPFF